MYDLIVFDWDGTIMDSEARIVACMQAAARDLGHEIPEHERTKDIIGLGLDEAVSRLFCDLEREQHGALADRYRKHFLADDLAHSVLFDGAENLLNTLVEQDYFIAVATGKSRRGLNKELGRTGLGDLFHTTRCADETFSKPHPQMLIDIMDRMGIEPSKTLVIGDTEYDVQMARNARADALGVSYGVHECQRLLDNGALACVDDVSEISVWLEERRIGAA